MVAHFGLAVVRAYMQPRPGQCRGVGAAGAGVLTDGAFDYTLDNGAGIRIAVTDRGGSAQRDHRFRLARRAAAHQFQCAPGGVQSRRCSTCSARSWTMRSRCNRRLPQAARDRDTRGLDAEPALSCGRRGG